MRALACCCHRPTGIPRKIANGARHSPHDLRRPRARRACHRGRLFQLWAQPDDRWQPTPAAQPEDRRRPVPLRAVRRGRTADHRQAAPLDGPARRACAQAAIELSSIRAMADAMRTTAVLLSVLGLLTGAAPSFGQTTMDWITNAPREAMPIKAWPDGKKVAVCFVLYVEVWGKGQGPNFRPDMAARNPDVVDEAFRQYAIEWGVPRVGRLFGDQGVPLSIALNAQFPEQHPEIWKQFRASVPKASIVAHGINNSTEMLPLDKGMEAQKAYIRRTLDMIEKSTGVRSRGWSSPSVFPNVDTYAATAAEGIKYSLDGMDSDVLTRLMTSGGPLVMIPYPAQTVDMGHY